MQIDYGSEAKAVRVNFERRPLNGYFTFELEPEMNNMSNLPVSHEQPTHSGSLVTRNYGLGCLYNRRVLSWFKLLV